MHTHTKDRGGQQCAGLLSGEEIREFQRLVREEYGVDLTLEQAWSRATQMVSLYRMLMGPIPEDPLVRTSNQLASGTVDDRTMLQ